MDPIRSLAAALGVIGAGYAVNQLFSSASGHVQAEARKATQEYFDRLAQNLELNPTFSELVQTRHAAVRAALGGGDSKLVGSLQRRTRIQPRPNDPFDIDILVVGFDFERWAEPGSGLTASAALEQLYERVQDSDRYSKKQPAIDSPTVTLKFAEQVSVELIPGHLDRIGTAHRGGLAHHPKGRAYFVPAASGWILADYDYDAAFITAQNEASGGWLVPTIKMLKAIRRVHFPALKSYGLEILAAQIVPAAVPLVQVIDYPELLRHFFAEAIGRLHYPLSIPGSLSPPINLPALEAAGIAGQFALLRDHIARLATTTLSERVEGWRVVFGDVFPARV